MKGGRWWLVFLVVEGKVEMMTEQVETGQQQQHQQAHLRHQQTGSGRQPTFYKIPPGFPQNQARTLQS